MSLPAKAAAAGLDHAAAPTPSRACSCCSELWVSHLPRCRAGVLPRRADRRAALLQRAPDHVPAALSRSAALRQHLDRGEHDLLDPPAPLAPLANRARSGETLGPMRTLLLRWSAVFLALILAAPATAHPVPFSYLDLEVRDGGV